jgi:hypothetical protein
MGLNIVGRPHVLCAPLTVACACGGGAQVSMTPVMDKNGKLCNFVAVEQEVAERKASEQVP